VDTYHRWSCSTCYEGIRLRGTCIETPGLQILPRLEEILIGGAGESDCPAFGKNGGLEVGRPLGYVLWLPRIVRSKILDTYLFGRCKNYGDTQTRHSNLWSTRAGPVAVSQHRRCYPGANHSPLTHRSLCSPSAQVALLTCLDAPIRQTVFAGSVLSILSTSDIDKRVPSSRP